MLTQNSIEEVIEPLMVHIKSSSACGKDMTPQEIKSGGLADSKSPVDDCFWPSAMQEAGIDAGPQSRSMTISQAC